MAQGDIQIIKCPLPNGPQSKMYITTYASTTTIKEGEPVEITTAGYYYVKQMVDGAPTVSMSVVTIGKVIGIAAGNENQNGNKGWTGYGDKNTMAGSVPVYMMTPGNVYAATVYGGATMLQSTYNALVGQLTTVNLSGGTFTVNTGHQSSGGTGNWLGGLRIEWIDVNKYPAKIAFSITNPVKYTDS